VGHYNVNSGKQTELVKYVYILPGGRIDDYVILIAITTSPRSLHSTLALVDPVIDGQVRAHNIDTTLP